MMFWQYTPLISQIDTLLEKEDVTLQEILDEDDVFQECKAQNKKLVDFLIIPQNLNQLVDYVLKDPPEDAPDVVKYKYPNIACEILSSDVFDINDALTDEDLYLDQFDEFLDTKPPLNPLSASFYMRVMAMLIQKKGDRVIPHLKERKAFLRRLVSHLGTSAIMELLLKMVQGVETYATKRQLTEWLVEEELVQQIVAGLDPKAGTEVNYNAAHCLNELIVTCRDQLFRHGCFRPDSDSSDGDDPSDVLATAMLDTIESSSTIEQIVSVMFREEVCESVLLSGMTVLQSLLDKRKNESPLDPPLSSPSEMEQERLSKAARAMVTALLPRLPRMMQLLTEPPTQRYSDMHTTMGLLSPPLGNTRLQIVRLLQFLLATNVSELLDALHAADFLAVIINLFFHYSLNTFLHRSVTDIVCHLLSASHPVHTSKSVHDGLLQQLIKDNGFIQKIVDIWGEDEAESLQTKASRRGYMGHLCRMANVFNDNREHAAHKESLASVFSDLDEEIQKQWIEFSEGPLRDYNARSAFDLFFSSLNRCRKKDESMLRSSGSLSEDGDDSLSLEFPTNLPLSTLQSAYSEYQAQQMTMTFADERGFKEDDFADTLDKIESIFTERIPIVSCEILTPEDTPNATMFEQACNEHMRQFDDPIEDELEDEDEEEEGDEASGKAGLRRMNVELNERYEDEDEDGEEEDEEDEHGWMERKLKLLPNAAAPATSPVTVTSRAPGSSEDEEDEEEGEESLEQQNGCSGDTKPQVRLRIPKLSDSCDSEESSEDEEDLSSPLVVRPAAARRPMTTFPDMGSLLTTRGPLVKPSPSVRPSAKTEAIVKQQNSNAVSSSPSSSSPPSSSPADEKSLDGPPGPPRKVWGVPDLCTLPRFHSSSSDDETEDTQADDDGRDRQEVAARMARYVAEEPRPERLFVRRPSPPCVAASEPVGSLVFSNLSTEAPASDEDSTPPSTPRTGAAGDFVRVLYEPSEQSIVDRLQTDDLDVDSPPMETPSNSPVARPAVPSPVASHSPPSPAAAESGSGPGESDHLVDGISKRSGGCDPTVYRSRCTLRLKASPGSKFEPPPLPQTNRPFLGRGRGRGAFSISRHTLNGPVKKVDEEGRPSTTKTTTASASGSEAVTVTSATNGPV